MSRKLIFLIVTAALVLTAGSAAAFFENTMVSARARAMGESAVAVPGDAYSAFYNPGLLAVRTNGEAGASYVQPFGLDFNDFYALGAVLPLQTKYGAIGVGLSQFKTSYQGVDLLKETQVTFSHGLTVFEDFHSRVDMGYSFNVYRVEQAETVSGLNPGDDTVVGVDFGMAVNLHQRTTMGFLIKNVNNPQIGLDEEELARRLIAGVTYQPYEDVLTTFEIVNELGQEVQYHGGIEAMVVDSFYLRAGLVTHPNKLTAGFGYSRGRVSVDYGFGTGGGTLDATHQFGVKVAWGGEAK